MSNSFAKNLFEINCSPLIFKNHPAIIHKNSAFKGIKTFEVAKSRKSKIVFPIIFTLSKTPNESDAGIAIADIIQNKIKQAFLRDILNLSVIDATGTSIMLIPDVTAAARSRIKKAAETILPWGILEKIYGRVTKTNPAPEFGSRPNENIAGKIIMPAISANKVSEKIII